jgi:ABC-type phosphate transport system permease subunit
MLVSQSITDLVSRWDSGDLPAIEHDIIGLQAVPLLLQCLRKTLHGQRADGAWGAVGLIEETAYAVLTLVSLLSLPMPATLSRKALAAMDAERRFLRARGDSHCEFLWIVKITYGSKHLLDAYVLSALHARPESLSSRTLPEHEPRLEEILLTQGQVDT